MTKRKRPRPDEPLPEGVDDVLRVPSMMKATGLKRTQLLDLVDEGIIPKPVKVGKSAIGWFRSDVIRYQERLRKQRDEAAAGAS